MLLKRLHTAFLCWGKLGFQDFERQSADPATNTPIPVIHVEMNSLTREMMVPRIGRGHQRHDSLFPTVATSANNPHTFPLSILFRLLPRTSRHYTVTVRKSSRLGSGLC